MRGSEKRHIQCLVEWLAHGESEPSLVAVNIYIFISLSTRYVPGPRATQLNSTGIPVLEELTQAWKRKKETEKLIWWDMFA